MTDEQPTALRLAHALDVLAEEIRLDVLPRWKNPDETMADAAVELRRLHARNAQLLNALEALSKSDDWWGDNGMPASLINEMYAAIKDARKKA